MISILLALHLFSAPASRCTNLQVKSNSIMEEPGPNRERIVVSEISISPNTSFFRACYITATTSRVTRTGRLTQALQESISSSIRRCRSALPPYIPCPHYTSVPHHQEAIHYFHRPLQTRKHGLVQGSGKQNRSLPVGSYIEQI